MRVEKALLERIESLNRTQKLNGQDGILFFFKNGLNNTKVPNRKNIMYMTLGARLKRKVHLLRLG